MTNDTLICFVLAAAGLVPMAACDSAPTAPTDPVVVTLAPGDAESANGLILTFVKVTADTRCPADAFCIHPGEAQVSVQTMVLGVSRTSELYLFDSAKRRVTHGSHTVTFEELNPYPFLSRPPIVPSAYRARFRID